jgi:hypothetical protein
LSEKNSAEILLYCVRSNDHFLFFKNFCDSSYFAEAKAVIVNARTFQDSLYFAEDNAMNGRAKTNFGFSRPDLVESKG